METFRTGTREAAEQLFVKNLFDIPLNSIQQSCHPVSIEPVVLIFLAFAYICMVGSVAREIHVFGTQ